MTVTYGECDGCKGQFEAKYLRYRLIGEGWKHLCTACRKLLDSGKLPKPN